jgi:hypothetical protein
MERIQEPQSPHDEVQAESERVQAELHAAQRTVEALEQQLAARTADLLGWQERAFKGRRPEAWPVLAALLGGLLLGAGIVTALHFLSGWALHLS